MSSGPCNSCTEDLLLTLGWFIWLPQSYALNAVVINQGNSSLYISLVDNNTTAPAQPGSLWALTTVAELIETFNFRSVLETLGYQPWSGTVAYSKNQGVIYNGSVCISSIAGNNTNIGNTPGSDGSWGVYTLFEVYQRWILNNAVFHG